MPVMRPVLIEYMTMTSIMESVLRRVGRMSREKLQSAWQSGWYVPLDTCAALPEDEDKDGRKQNVRRDRHRGPGGDKPLLKGYDSAEGGHGK